ncbi:MAG TPA: Ig-like domain-containing protein [Longimicrobium sp.]|nr:Ig-like domain-containing protein [Longimicrobium sp.]
MPIPRIIPRGWSVLAALSLTLAGCTDSISVEEPAALNLLASADSLVSNSQASVVVSAELPPSLPRNTEVVFSTSLGRLINPGAPSDRKVTVRARDGAAEARLIPAGEVGTAYVTATAAGSTAQITVELTPVLPESIDLFVDRTAAPADGSTAVTATAVLRGAAGTASRGIPVSFQARDSATQAPVSALGGVMLSDTAGTARIRLTSPVARTILIQAFAGTAESEARSIRFTPLPTPAP